MDERQIKQAEERGYGKIKQILHTAIILHAGWEMDNEGWIVELEDGTIKGLTTSHGGVYEWSIGAMNERISATEESLASMKKAREFLA